jgi:PAS domain S-box-containing protein
MPGESIIGLDSTKGPAFALVVLALLATLILWPLNISARWDPAPVNLILQIVFIGIASFFISAMAIRSFLRTGEWPVLWLGAGSLTFGVAVPLSGVLLPLVGPNAAVTTHNLNALIAAALHFTGAFFVSNEIASRETPAGRASIILQVFLASLGLLAVVTAGAIAGVFPPFFVQGQGGTILRQMILVFATLLFFLSGLVFWREYRRRGINFLYWYSLGLVLISIGLGGVLIANVLGSPLNWVGRASQFLAGLYLLVAALVTRQEARARNLPPDQVLASFFRSRDANLKLLFDSISDALVVTDPAFVITGWNAAAEQTYGWAASEVIGRPAREVLQTRYPPGTDIDKAQAELVEKGAWRAEVIQRHRSGADVTVLASVSLLRASAGDIIGAVAVERDITPRKKAEEQIAELNRTLTRRAGELEAANRELEAFAYSVSHDLRAPLRGIDGFSLALLEDYGDRLDGEGQGYLRMLRQNAQRMGDLIDDLLAFSRLGRQPISRQPADLRQIAERAWEELESARAERAVEFRLGALPASDVDPSLIRQVYLNLFSNALKFSRGRSPAVIEAGCDTSRGNQTVFYVKDNGAGFEMQYAEKLFGVFQRLHRAEEYEGTGVGLAIVQRIVHRHGGRVWAEGEVGRGATFYFTLGEKHCE